MPGWPLPPGKPAIYPSSAAGVTAPTLESWQLYFNELTFGAATSVGVTNIEGLIGLGNVQSADQPYPRDTGEARGVDSKGGRDIVLDLTITSYIVTYMEALGAFFDVSPSLAEPLWFQIPGLEILCSMCRPRNRTEDINPLVAAGAIWMPVINLHANDPRLYGQGNTVYNTANGAASYTLNAYNAGNTEVRPVLILNGGSGGLESPSITNSTIGSNAVTAFQSGFTVAAGDTVVVDLDTPHTCIYHTGGVGSGGSVYSCYNQLDLDTTTWWTLLPGNNECVCAVGAGTIHDNSDMGIWWSNAYLL